MCKSTKKSDLLTKHSICPGAPGRLIEALTFTLRLIKAYLLRACYHHVLCTQHTAEYMYCNCRLHRADQKLLLYMGIIQALLAGWALLLSVTAGTQPVIACEYMFSACNLLHVAAWHGANAVAYPAADHGAQHYSQAHPYQNCCVVICRSTSVIWCTAAAVSGGVANVWKLNQIFPAPTSSTASRDDKKQGTSMPYIYVELTQLSFSAHSSQLTSCRAATQ